MRRSVYASHTISETACACRCDDKMWYMGLLLRQPTMYIAVCAIHIRHRGRRLATGWRVRHANPGSKRRFVSFQIPSVQPSPEAHPASYTMGTGIFPGVKRPERGIDHTPPSNTTLWPFLACSSMKFTFALQLPLHPSPEHHPASYTMGTGTFPEV